MSEPLDPGKLPMDILLRALGSAVSGVSGGPSGRSGLRQGPGVGRDAAIVEFGAEALVAASDPITFVDADAGRLAVTVNANDILAVGAEPRWMLATVLAPAGSDAADVAALVTDLQSACDAAGVALIGGHTEITDAVRRSVVSCTMIGSAPLGQIVPSDGAQDGDLIIQAGRAAVEGTAILGAPELFDDPGVSIASAARALREIAGVHAMHDVTEGGIATAALELAEAAGLAPQLDADSIIWLPQTLQVCEDRSLDPLGLLGSGTLLAAVHPLAADAALAALSAAAVDASLIGTVREGSRATLRSGGRVRALPHFARDEALRALDAAAPTPTE